MSRRRLGVVVFTAGAGTLATEIAASRLLAPYFGSSTIVWANIIGLILVYLSVGYWIGGKVADRRPEPRLLGWIVLVAALVIAVLPFVARPILDFTVQGLDTISVGAVVGSFFAALLLFAVPVTLLGAVSPFADPARPRRRHAGGRGRRTPLRALDGREHRRHLRLGDRHHPAHRHAADDARRRRPCSSSRPRSCSAAAGRSSRSGGRAPLRPRRDDQGDRRARLRDGVGLPVHPGRRARRRLARPPAERGRRRPLRLAAGHRAHRRRVGHVPRSCRRSSTGRSSACS